MQAQPLLDPTTQLQDMVVYEVNPRAFSDEGSLDAVTARLDEIQSLGANTLWFMPLHPVGEVNRKGVLGSPYSISDYRAIGSEYGTLEDMQELVDAAHGRGMSVVMDWVANHTAWDHPWIDANPSWYTQNGAGQIVHPPGTDWTDVADLNFDNPAMRSAMIDEMKFWVQDVGIDGYRVDAADFVPFDFWQDAVAEVRAAADKPLLMLAEGGRSDHYDADFDLTYGWNFYGTAKSVFNGGSATWLEDAHRAEFGNAPGDRSVLRFTTNHDETAWDAPPTEVFGSLEGSLAAYAATLAFGGVPLIYNGQEVGVDRNIQFFDRDPIDWDQNPEVRDWYQWALGVRADEEALRRGSVQDASNDDVVLVRREYNGEQVFALVNTRDYATGVFVPGTWQGEWTNLATDTLESLGFYRQLEPYEVVFLSGASPLPQYVVAGQFQDEQGDPSDWDPTNSSLILLETPEQGVYALDIPNLNSGQAYDFKVVSDAGDGPAEWGDPELTPYDLTLFGDADGTATLVVDTQNLNGQGNPQVWAVFDDAPLQVAGDFMNEAGLGFDWNPSDPDGQMTAQGDGYYTFDAVISDPGSYLYKATFGDGWGDQVGVDGFGNAATAFEFVTWFDDEAVTFYVDLANREIGVLRLWADSNGDGVVDLLDFDTMAESFGDPATTGPLSGDFNGDGVVDLLDFDLLAFGFGTTSPVVIPEPASLALLAFTGPLLVRGRRRG
ncbi:MAG: alpha-amylase family glycosyl hydrolase [Planctomycetota bacterium]